MRPGKCTDSVRARVSQAAPGGGEFSNSLDFSSTQPDPSVLSSERWWSKVQVTRGFGPSMSGDTWTPCHRVVSTSACFRPEFVLCSGHVGATHNKAKIVTAAGDGRGINPCGFDGTVFARDPARRDWGIRPDRGWLGGFRAARDNDFWRMTMASTSPTPRKQRFRLHEIETALRAAGGVYAHAAKLLSEATGRSCTRQNIQHWIRKHPSLIETVREAAEEIKDLAETALIGNIRNGDTNAIKFYLETKAKDRGYVRQHKVTSAEGQPITVPPPQVVLYLPDNGRDPEIVQRLGGYQDEPIGPSSC